MYLQPSTLRYGIRNHLEFLDIEVNKIDHHKVNKKFHPNDDLYKLPNPKSSNYYLQNPTSFKRDVYNSKQSRPETGYDDFQPDLAEKIADSRMNVLYNQTHISQIPRMAKSVKKP